MAKFDLLGYLLNRDQVNASGPPEPVPPESALSLVGRSPDDAMHSVFDVIQLLWVLKLQDWIPRLMTFLRHYDGLEYAFSPWDIQPMVLCRQALYAQLLHLNGDGVDPHKVKVEVTNVLAEAIFAAYGASFRLRTLRHDLERVIVWHPLQQSWLDFVAAEPAEADQYELCVGPASQYCVKPDEIRAFLLAD
jgi:hypothetical protein